MIAIQKNSLRDINVKALLRYLYEGDVSQSELIIKTGLKKATVSNLISSLTSQGLVMESGAEELTGKKGRRRQYLTLNRKKIAATGIALRNKRVKAALITLEGRIAWSDEIELPEVSSTYFAPRVIKMADAALKVAKQKKLAHLGASFIAGSIYDPRKNVFKRFSENTETNLAVDSLFKGRITVADDFPYAMALGEMWFGACRTIDDFLYLQLLNPFLAIVLGRKVFRGHHLEAGKIGNVKAGSALFSEQVGSNADFYRSSEFITWLSDLILYYDPEKIVLSGENCPQDIESLLKTYNESCNGRIMMGTLSGNEATLAAASLVFEKHFYGQFS